MKLKKADDTKMTAVQKQGDGQADINIFTVASGLLYEVGPVWATATAFSAFYYSVLPQS